MILDKNKSEKGSNAYFDVLVRLIELSEPMSNTVDRYDHDAGYESSYSVLEIFREDSRPVSHICPDGLLHASVRESFDQTEISHASPSERRIAAEAKRFDAHGLRYAVVRLTSVF